MKTVILVESPTKARKIQKFFNPNDNIYVYASNGHIRDLPKKNTLGFNISDLKPHWEICPDKKKHVHFLKKVVSGKKVILATDLDREGEAIAWHLKKVLNLKNPVRVGFTEITEKAVKDALKKNTRINNDLVNAYTTRRLLDRFIGFTVSPLLGYNLSAGRVQSVALKICDIREQQIRNFTSQNHFEITSEINNTPLKLDTVNLEKDEKFLFSKSLADQITTNVKELTIESVLTSEKKIQPRPPFITSTLQQAASSVLNISPDETSSSCQKLFEAGLITYHRTDNPNYSNDGFELLCQIAKENNINVREQQIKRKSKDAQEAHEAIRITDIRDLSESQKNILSTDSVNKIFQLIKERSLTSVSVDGKDSITEITAIADKISLNGDNKNLFFNTKGRLIIEAGWREYCSVEKPSSVENSIDRHIGEGDKFIVKPQINIKKTKAPERFTEATLIKALVHLGIGRPSTYSSIIVTLKEKKYIKVKNRLITTQLIGSEIVSALSHMNFMRFDFTKTVEDQLDLIAKSQQSHLSVLEDVIKIVINECKTLKPEFTHQAKTSAPCPHCHQPLRFIKNNKSTFWVHVHENENCLKYIDDKNGSPSNFISKTTDCPRCGSEIQSKQNTSGQYWVHSSKDHDCIDFIPDKKGEPLIPQTATCPECENLIIKKTKFSTKDKKNYEFYVHAKSKTDCSLKYITQEELIEETC